MARNKIRTIYDPKNHLGLYYHMKKKIQLYYYMCVIVTSTMVRKTILAIKVYNSKKLMVWDNFSDRGLWPELKIQTIVLLKKRGKMYGLNIFLGHQPLSEKSSQIMLWDGEKNSQFYDYMRNIFNSFYFKKKIVCCATSFS
jgi:hypothetical protein